MTGYSDEGWTIIADDDEAENIPLWRALARFTRDDPDEGLELNAAVINQEKPAFKRYYNAAFLFSLISGLLSFIFFAVMLIVARTDAADTLFLIVLILLALTAAPQIWRQLYQYGATIPSAPLALPHEADRHFDEFLSYLQRASAPHAYYTPRFGKKRKRLDRHNFFGRLRYLTFSEHSADRRLVMRFSAGLALPSDIFVHRDDLEKMIALNKPKRKGGPGTKAKYPYEDAIVGLIGDPRLAQLDLGDHDASVQSLANWIVEWFKENGDASGDAPRTDYARVQACAKKIYAHLKSLPPSMRL